MYSLQPKQKNFLETLNPVFVLLFFYTVMIARTTFDSVLPEVFDNLDILLPFIVYFGQRRSVAEGLTLAILSAHFYSLSSSAPVGLFVVHYLVLFFLARGLSYIFYPDRWNTICLALFVLSVVSRLVAWPMAALFEHSLSPAWGGVVMGWFFNTVFGYFIFVAIAILDHVTAKASRINIEMSEGSL